jgi:hypothetical protein
LTGLSSAAVVAAAAGVAALEIGVGDSAAKTPAEVNDNMIEAVAIVLLNFMVDPSSFFPLVGSLTLVASARQMPNTSIRTLGH